MKYISILFDGRIKNIMKKKIKKISDKFIDSGREYLQIIVLFICFMFPKLVGLSEIIRTILGGQKPNFETAKYYYLMLSGNYVMGLLITLYVLFNFIRKANKETVLNKGNVYHKHNYAWYWFCSKVLGYDRCNLILVPIQMQFKLLLRDTFKEYPFNENMFPNEKNKINIINNDVNKLNEFTIILEDTYPINNNQIPYKYLKMNLVKISRISDKIGKRVYCEEFIDCISEQLRLLPEKSIINIFATTNPKTNYSIAKKVLCLADRSNLIKVNIFQQSENGSRNFLEKVYTVIDHTNE